MLAMEIAAERIAHMFRTDHPNARVPSQYVISIKKMVFLPLSEYSIYIFVWQKRNLRSIINHFCSYLLAEEKIEQVQNVLKKAYEFLDRLGLENTEIDLLVVNWCKLKRNLAQQKNNNIKRTTIIDFLPIPSSCAFQFLFKELSTYRSFRY